MNEAGSCNYIRENIEKRELELLSPYAAKSAKTRGRAKPESPCPIRTEFQRDKDRIIHSKAFRRLKHKTQVFFSPTNDHYRTRMTHTLEVSQIARTIARALDLNEDLTEAIALGHDLGHTPFGHSGEEVLNEIMAEGFRHSEHSVRVVTTIENLNLTQETIDGIKNHSGSLKIESKAFYSCWALECIYVDENNPNYCDIDGVLYNKDKTEVICYPINHDEYLCEKYGFTQYDESGNWAELTVEDPEFEQYKKDVLTYVVPSTVTEIDELAFNYAYLADVYFPEGLKTIETLAFFKSTRLENVYTYKTDDVYEDTHFSSQEPLGEVYLSLPLSHLFNVSST